MQGYLGDSELCEVMVEDLPGCSSRDAGLGWDITKIKHKNKFIGYLWAYKINQWKTKSWVCSSQVIWLSGRVSILLLSPTLSEVDVHQT